MTLDADFMTLARQGARGSDEAAHAGGDAADAHAYEQATQAAETPHDSSSTKPESPSHSGSWLSRAWDGVTGGVSSAYHTADNAVHGFGHTVDSLAQTGVQKATGAVRSIAGNGSAQVFHNAAEGTLDAVKQDVGFSYGVTTGALEAAGGMVKSTGDLIGDAGRFATDSQFRGQVVDGAEHLASTIAHDPVGSGEKLVHGAVQAGKNWVQGAEDAARNGNIGEYLGHSVGDAAVNVGSLFIPGAGEADAVNLAAKGGEAAEALGRAGSALSDASKLGEGAADASRASGRIEGLAGRGAEADRAASAGHAEPIGEGARPQATPTKTRTMDNLDEFNAAANKAEPNTTYKFGDYSWTTDDRGRTIEASGKVQVQEFGRNDTKLQAQIGHEGKDTDIGFHLIADSLNGPTNRLNVVPGNGRPIGDGLPNLNQGAYKKFENAVRSLANGSDKPVEVRITPQYKPGNVTSRPDSFVAAFRQEGGAWFKQSFINK